MKEEDLEKFTDDLFREEKLDEVASNFEYLVMQKIQAETLEITAKPLISPFKWTLIGLFAITVVFVGFYFNTGDNPGNISKINNILNSIWHVDLSPITLVSIAILALFIVFQVLFLRVMHKKNLAP